MIASAPRPDVVDALERELSAIAARVRVALYQQIAWRESRAGEPPSAGAGDGDRRAWASSDSRGRELAATRAQLEAALPAMTPRLRRLGELFGLDRRELDLVQVTLAVAIAPDLAGAVTAACCRPAPTEALVADLFEHGVRRVLTPDSPLARWQLVRRVELGPGEPDGLAVDPAIADWFTGAYAIEAALVELARPVPAVAPLPGWPLDDLVAAVTARWDRGEPGPVRVLIAGPPGAGRTSFAAALAHRLGLGLLAIDADAADESSWPEVVRRAHRQAFLTQTAVAFVGEAAARRGWPRLPAAFPLSMLIVEPGQTPAPMSDVVDVAVELPPTSTAEREALWRALVPTATAWPPDAVAELARRYRASPGDIAAAARRGVSGPDAAAAFVRDRAIDRLGDLARRMECPFTWDDLVLSPAALEALRDFEYEGQVRAELWEARGLRRLFPQGRGLYALLTGAPGTGKTMAAQVIARALGLNLYRISLATVVSKYVGETAKNLTRILARAEHLDAVLLFDEADALFGKRTEIKDAHDRYANTDTNHLLQAIESYAGVAILASNKRANIDAAFIRRLRYVLELPKPDAIQRRTLWRRIVDEVIGGGAAERMAGAIETLGGAIELTGAQIKYAALAALLAARRDGGAVTVRHLVRGVERELAKDGRSLSEREREQVTHAW